MGYPARLGARSLGAAVLLLVSQAALWGAPVTGRITLKDSRAPEVNRGQDYSGVVVSLKPANGAPAAHNTGRHARMVQRDKTFIPHVLAIQVGTVIDFPNYDPIFHNAFSNYNGQVFDVGLYPPGTSRSVAFSREGIVRVFCNIHSSMSAVIVVLGSPWFATTRRDGSFEIADVPPGEYVLSVFHERATAAELSRLRRSVTVGAETAALGMLAISEAGYLTVPHKNKYNRDYPATAGDATLYPATRK
jgi:plastocyanin